MREILAVHVGGRSYERTVEQCVEWAEHRESRTVIFANVHVVMEAFDNPFLRAELNKADIVNPDGMPLVWALRALGERDASRVYGPDTTEMVLQAAERSGIPVGFYGSAESTLEALTLEVRRRYPELKIVFTMSPPFRPLNVTEDEEIVRLVSASGARILFVGLGCPKQESWVMAHRNQIPAVMLAVGAAFDYLANTKPQAPRWMMRSGLEWLFRLCSEPRRLAGRYLKHNPRFVGLFVRDWLTKRAT